MLRKQLLKLVGWLPIGEDVFMARARHLEALIAVRNNLNAASQLLSQPELIAEELRLAQESLNSITGEFTSHDLLGEIFSKFCIGK